MPAKLSYLMLYQKSGLPIFSKCFSDFCSMAFKEPVLLTGFLTALQNLSQEISKGQSLEAIQMGNTIMRFTRTLPTGHSLVIGMTEDDLDMVEQVTVAISNLLKSDEYKNINWEFVDENVGEKFAKELIEKALIPSLHSFGGFHDDCALGDQCPMKTLAASKKDKKPIWDRIKDNYQKLKEKMMKK